MGTCWMGDLEKEQIYIGYDENNELVECIKVYSGKAIDKKPK